MWNRHRESEIHDIHEIGSGTKLYYLWVKGYSTWGERERHNLSMLTTFTSALNHVRHLICKLLVWPRRAPKVNLLVRTQLPAFSQIPKILSPRFRCMTLFTPTGPIFYLWFYFYICEWHILPVRAWPPALMFAPNKPMHWAERFSS